MHRNAGGGILCLKLSPPSPQEEKFQVVFSPDLPPPPQQQNAPGGAGEQQLPEGGKSRSGFCMDEFSIV